MSGRVFDVDGRVDVGVCGVPASWGLADEDRLAFAVAFAGEAAGGTPLRREGRGLRSRDPVSPKLRA